MLTNETYNRVNHITLSVQNQNKWFMKLGTWNCANYSTWNPKRSAKYVYHTWTSASSTARAGTSCEEEQRRIRNSSSTRGTSFLFLTTTYRKGDPTGTVTGRSQGTENTTSPIHSRSVKSSTRVSTIDSYETKSSATTWLTQRSNRRNLSPNGWLCGRRPHPPFSSVIVDYRSNWWIRSNKIGSFTMPIWHRSDFRQGLSTSRQLKDKEDEAQRKQIWTKSYSSSWWN